MLSVEVSPAGKRGDKRERKKRKVEGEGLAVVISCNPIWGGGGAPREIFIGTTRGRLQRQEGIRRWKVNTRRIGGKMCRSTLN